MIKRICVILILSIILFLVYSSTSNAIGNAISSADDFLSVESGDLMDEGSIKEVFGDLYNVLLALGIIIAVIIAAVLGIQFMTGSVETQAKVKESLIPFVIGCVIIFGAFGIWRAVVSIGSKLENSNPSKSSYTNKGNGDGGSGAKRPGTVVTPEKE